MAEDAYDQEGREKCILQGMYYGRCSSSCVGLLSLDDDRPLSDIDSLVDCG